MVSLDNYFITGEPIPHSQFGTIHQPSIKEILSIGCSIEDFIYPFLLRIDNIDISNSNLSELKKHLKDFDLFFMQSSSKDNDENSILHKLLDILSLLYKNQNVKLVYDEQTIYIDNKIEINKNNFTEFSNLILEMFQTKEPEKSDNKPKYKDKNRQALWEKLEKRREAEEKKKALSLADIINLVVHMNGYVSYKEVSEMTYYQLLNTYKTMLSITSYNEYLMFKSSGQFEMKQENKHWTTETKIKKSTLNI